VDLQIDFMLTIDAIDGLKMPSLSSMHWGSMFRLDFNKSLMEIKIFADGFAQLIMENNKLSEANISMSSNSTIDVLLPFTGIKELGLAAIFKKHLWYLDKGIRHFCYQDATIRKKQQCRANNV
jgi:hypothetical protein